MVSTLQNSFPRCSRDTDRFLAPYRYGHSSPSTIAPFHENSSFLAFDDPFSPPPTAMIEGNFYNFKLVQQSNREAKALIIACVGTNQSESSLPPSFPLRILRSSSPSLTQRRPGVPTLSHFHFFFQVTYCRPWLSIIAHPFLFRPTPFHSPFASTSPPPL